LFHERLAEKVPLCKNFRRPVGWDSYMADAKSLRWGICHIQERALKVEVSQME